MKVVLKQDIKEIGKKDELHEVSAGYARNYLFPRGLAIEADSTAMNEVKTKQAARQHHADVLLITAQELGKKIDGSTVTLKAKAGQGGRLFGSITVKDIAAALSEKGFNIDKRKLNIEGVKEIKAFGNYNVEAKIYNGVLAKFSCKVEE